VLHVGVGVSGGLQTLIAAFVAWWLLAALASARLASWWIPASSSAADRDRRTRRVALGFVAILVGSLVVAIARDGRTALAVAVSVFGIATLVIGRRIAPRRAGAAALVLAAIAGTARWWSVTAVEMERTEPPPGSIVLIVLDTTRADVFGAYGAESGETPVFDRLAGEGLLFEEIVSHSPWTVPSHATFFTGLPPRQHDCWFGGRRWLDDRLETLAESLAARGYETAAFYGNLNLAEANLLQGFEVQEYVESSATLLSLGWLARFTGIGPDEWIDRGANRAVSRIGSWLRQRRSRRPFFLFVNLFEAHEPFVSPIRDHAPPQGVSELESFFALQTYRQSLWHSLGRERGREVEIVRAAYRASIRYQDRKLGQLLEVLGKRYVVDRLPIVITADHGENLGDGGRWGHHYSLNEALIHLPFVILAPARLGGARRVSGGFASHDLPATLLDLAGVGDRFQLGRSLLGERQVEATTFAEDFPFYVGLHGLERDNKSGLGDFPWPISAARGEGHKLVVWHGGSTRLYDLEGDPAESVDLLAQRPEIARRLAERLARWWVEVPRIHRTQGASEAPGRLDPDLAEQLRALGYL